MLKNLSLSYFILIALTLIIASAAYLPSSKPIAVGIIVVSFIKLLTVAFRFMELKDAHRFWKWLLILYSVLIGSIVILML